MCELSWRVYRVRKHIATRRFCERGCDAGSSRAASRDAVAVQLYDHIVSSRLQLGHGVRRALPVQVLGVRLKLGLGLAARARGLVSYHLTPDLGLRLHRTRLRPAPPPPPPAPASRARGRGRRRRVASSAMQGTASECRGVGSTTIYVCIPKFRSLIMNEYTQHSTAMCIVIYNLQPVYYSV